MELHNPDQVADLFVDTCRRLRDLGATSVKAFGCQATFGPVPTQAPESDEMPREAPIVLSPEAQAFAARTQRLAEGALR